MGQLLIIDGEADAQCYVAKTTPCMGALVTMEEKSNAQRRRGLSVAAGGRQGWAPAA